MKELFAENEEFYPTPASLIEKMLDGIDFSMIQSVLEPSAGKGDIVNAVKEHCKKHRYTWDSHTPDIYCIEKDEMLRQMLIGQGQYVVHDDFLSFRTFQKFDLILMNPPFSDGDKHLLKALDIQKDGGYVVCILNAETIRNPYTNSRKELVQKLKEYNADIQYIEGAFSGFDSERKSDVEIALIKVCIPEAERTSFLFDELEKKVYAEPDYDCTDLIAGDYIARILKQYEVEVEAGVRLINEYIAMKPRMISTFDEEAQNYAGSTLNLRVGRHDSLSVNEYVEAVRSKYWSALFHNKEFTGKLTAKLLEDLYDSISDMRHYDFSAANIKMLQQKIESLIVRGIEDSIMRLFDTLSEKYSWYSECEKNIHYYNGWASNKAHLINKKVIIPMNGVFYDKSWGYSYAKFRGYEAAGILCDIEKALSYLDKGDIDILSPADMGKKLELCGNEGVTKDIEFKYFSVTLYKKGTCHITFHDPKLLERFNIFGSRKKGWLPPCYGKKKYADMDAEEQAVIDEFQGREEYERVVLDPGTFIIEPESAPMLAAAI